MNIQEALADGTKRLEAAGDFAGGHDARHLLAEALGVERMVLSLEPDRILSKSEAAAYEGFIVRRMAHEPVSRILGRRIFWDRWFKITPQVLDPRPESETLIAAILSRPAPRRLLDLGTGSGILAVTLLSEWPRARAVATDLSPGALKVARANAVHHAVADRVDFVASDWFANVTGTFDLIVSNPPYIAADELPALAPEVLDHDPAMALTPGRDGLAAYRAITAGARGNDVHIQHERPEQSFD